MTRKESRTKESHMA